MQGLSSIQEVDMKKIPLTKKQFALVDDHDFDYLNQWKWYAHKGTNARTFYAIRKASSYRQNGITFRMHRVIMNNPKGKEIDHINGNGLDNRRANLRLATTSENQMNRRKQSNNTSGFMGVCWNKLAKKWQANITFRGRHFHVGLYLNKADAAKARDNAAKKIHGKFARLNFPARAEMLKRIGGMGV